MDRTAQTCHGRWAEVGREVCRTAEEETRAVSGSPRPPILPPLELCRCWGQQIGLHTSSGMSPYSTISYVCVELTGESPSHLAPGLSPLESLAACVWTLASGQLWANLIHFTVAEASGCWLCGLVGIGGEACEDPKKK